MDKDERSRFKAEKAQHAKSVAAKMREIEKEDTVRVRFYNNEDPPTKDKPSPELEFSKEGIRYNVYHGKEYDLPISVIEHLNNLKIPIYGWSDPDPVTGERRSEVKQWFYRFTCTPVNMQDAVTKKPGRPPKDKEAE